MSYKSKTTENIIVCPNCNHQYLPSEIFLPDAFLGKPSNIVKTDAGEIDFYVGNSMDLSETFCCTHCDKVFTVSASVSFTSSIDNRFDEEFESKIDNRIQLFEGF